MPLRAVASRLEANDVDALVQTLATDAELVLPVSGRMVFRGRDDLRVLLGAVYGSVTQLRWREQVGQDAVRLVIGDCLIGPLKLGDAMVLELAADGQIKRIRPHLRPWLALTFFALKLGPKVVRHPGLLWRALHRG